MKEKFAYFDDIRILEHYCHGDVYFEWDVEGGIFSMKWRGSKWYVRCDYEKLSGDEPYSRISECSYANTYIVEGLF